MHAKTGVATGARPLAAASRRCTATTSPVATIKSISAHMQRMEPYMQHVADQQAANHRGQVQLNESFYQYTLHQHNQDPSPYSWLTPEQFGATIAWPGDRSNFQAGEGPARTPRDEDGAQENDDTTNVMNFFL